MWFMALLREDSSLRSCPLSLLAFREKSRVPVLLADDKVPYMRQVTFAQKKASNVALQDR